MQQFKQHKQENTDFIESQLQHNTLVNQQIIKCEANLQNLVNIVKQQQQRIDDLMGYFAIFKPQAE